ncbi:transposase [Barrientosiimonas endolithica]|uniref:transposase n=1 Tax=Barrientosiimonas endolithica TaxID=1535208 RepID=UPI00259B395E|nr:transposase [Barrientosiimonas endolithica]
MDEDRVGQARQALSRELLGAEIRTTRIALANLALAVRNMEERVDQWAKRRPGSVTDEVFLLQTMKDLGQLKRRSDAAVKQLAIHAVRDRGLSARMVARELGIAHTTITRWVEASSAGQ